MEVDLPQVIAYGKNVAIGGLSLGFFWTTLWPILLKWFQSLPTEKVTPKPTQTDDTTITTERSADKPAPEGFVEHLKIIQEAAPNGDPSVWWGYALLGLTEAQTMREEVKLASHKSAPTIPEIK